jgi:hypothetical protein
MLTFGYGTGTICPNTRSVQFNAQSGLCCKESSPDGSCASWCQPGAVDCLPESAIIPEDASETIRNVCLAAAMALEQFAAAIPETDFIPAESPWNLNDRLVDFTGGGTVGWTALLQQIDGFVDALNAVDWDGALYALYGEDSSGEVAADIKSAFEVAGSLLAKHRPPSAEAAPPPAPTCINAFSFSSVPDVLAANADPAKLRAGLVAMADLLNRLMRVNWSATTENMPVESCTETFDYPYEACTYTASHAEVIRCSLSLSVSLCLCLCLSLSLSLSLCLSLSVCLSVSLSHAEVISRDDSDAVNGELLAHVPSPYNICVQYLSM